MPQKSVRLLKKGDIIRYEGAQGEVIEEVVRDVQIILFMANGENRPVAPTDTAEVIPPEDVRLVGEEINQEPSITGDETHVRRDL